MGIGERVASWLLIIAMAGVGYMVGHNVPFGPKDYRTHGALSTLSAVVESGHEYQLSSEEVAVLYDKTSDKSYYISKFDSKHHYIRELPKKFAYVGGVVIDKEPCKCRCSTSSCGCKTSAVSDFDKRGTFVMRPGETYTQYANRWNDYGREAAKTWKRPPTQVDPE